MNNDFSGNMIPEADLGSVIKEENGFDINMMDESYKICMPVCDNILADPNKFMIQKSLSKRNTKSISKSRRPKSAKLAIGSKFHNPKNRFDEDENYAQTSGSIWR